MKSNLFFDKVIAKTAFLKSVTSKFNIVWFTIMFTTTVLLMIVLTILGVGSIDKLGNQIIMITVMVLTTVCIFNILNLNLLFSSNKELGIMNLELRKGRKPSAIFLTRLLINKSLTFSYIILMMVVFLIITTIFDERNIKLFWLFLTFIPLDLILTGIFLFCFAFWKYKLAISIASIIFIFIVGTPVLQIIGSLAAQNISKGDFSEIEALKRYSADQVFEIYQKDETNFAYKMLKDGKNLNNLIDEVNFDSEQKYAVKSYYGYAIDAGILTDLDLILDKCWEELASYPGASEKPNEIKLDTNASNTLIFKINQQYSQQVGSFFNDYNDSLYLDNKITNIKFNNIIMDLEQLIQTMNQDYNNLVGITEFNKIVLNYANSMLFNKYSNYVDGRGYKYISYLEKIWEIVSTNKIDKINKSEIFNLLSISPAMRLWNQITLQLVGNALNLSKDNYSTVKSNDLMGTLAIPWVPQYQTWLFADPTLTMFEYYRLNKANLQQFSIYWIYNYASYYNDVEKTFGQLFKPLGDVKKNNLNVKKEFKSFSIVGYNLVLTSLAIIFIGGAFFFFVKRIKS
ncbi:hypothetical protein [Spiroplasma chrysopicola]|uniref:Uncharacterized protein n=1 Tax=Spiroplasma chrysopicola DF-1 TaxID=1276227 RepID=R4U4S5_9MOLU|nr:hypothetical protein [Spiroplasma chrysopicola]AGM25563.1 hypothetical protein SCHRY_v1c09910 [Spiroplasma chrysopicola DF-1]